jgi:membrane-associated protein
MYNRASWLVAARQLLNVCTFIVKGSSMGTFIEFFLHIDKHLEPLLISYGAWVYLILFLIIFCETGLVVTPFLPGDSLLFAAGALAAATGALNPVLLFIVLALAAIAGDTANYFIGHFFGLKIFEMNIPFLKKEYLDRTHEFYEKYGGKTIILARFVPIVRTFAPFVAGVGSMTYSRFITYNIVGGIAWIALFIFSGYFIGNVPLIKNNFSIVTVLIILISVLPMVYEFVRSRRAPVVKSQA